MYSNPSASSLPHLNYRWVFAASLLLSAWLIALDPLINRDAIIYLRSADAYLRDGFAASQQLYGRPILPICMAMVHKFTGIPMVYAGLILVSLAYALMCSAFVATVHTLGGDRRVQLIAAIVIISHPMLNHSRSSIMRDPIYWAFLLMAFRELLLYLQQPNLAHRLRWFAYVLLATLFRFEGAFFAVLAPLSLLFTPGLEQRLRHCLYLLVPQFLLVMLATAGYLALSSDGGLLFPAIEKYITRLQSVPAEFGEIAQNSADALLTFTAREDAAFAAVTSLVALLALNICRAMTWPWVITLLWGATKNLTGRFRPEHSALLLAHLLIGLFYLSLFLFINRFMLERYGSQVVIFLLLYIPFVLNSLWHAKGGAWKRVLVATLLLGMTLDSAHTGAGDKAFIRDAAQWVEEETPKQSSVVSNSKYIGYFGNREFDWRAVALQNFDLKSILARTEMWRDEDYLVMYVRPRDQENWEIFLRRNKLTELISFGSGKKGRVAVIQL